ncbi:MAG: ATP synthase F1 subunit gamma [Clostridia bacterium]|nr:ATP synthase F1 subunit gamma [Clostridia bacterium]
MAASSMKDIKNRTKSVEGTMHITKAMELVASSKLRRAKERAQQTLPFMNLLHDTISGIVSNCGSGVMSTYTTVREHKKSCIVLVAGDRGLAGGFNNNVFKLALEIAGENDVCYYPIGRKAYEFCIHHGYELLTDAPARADESGTEECAHVCEVLTREYAAGRFDKLYVIYNEFVSMLSQEPKSKLLLPMSSQNTNEKKSAKALTLYEPSPEAVIDAIVPQYIGGMVYAAVCESLASEYGARRMAMESATNNAAEMIDELNLCYNRARQAAITQEITEIVSGAGAL